MNLVLALFLIVFEATYEGLRVGGHPIVSEYVELAYLIAVSLIAFSWLNRRYVFAVPPMQSFLKVLIGYLLLRFALFDYIWNVAAGQSLDYIGSTKSYDAILAWIRDMWGIGTVHFIRTTLGIWGLSWLCRWGNK